MTWPQTCNTLFDDKAKIGHIEGGRMTAWLYGTPGDYFVTYSYYLAGVGVGKAAGGFANILDPTGADEGNPLGMPIMLPGAKPNTPGLSWVPGVPLSTKGIQEQLVTIPTNAQGAQIFTFVPYNMNCQGDSYSLLDAEFIIDSVRPSPHP